MIVITRGRSDASWFRYCNCTLPLSRHCCGTKCTYLPEPSPDLRHFDGPVGRRVAPASGDLENSGASYHNASEVAYIIAWASCNTLSARSHRE